ncbi:EPS-associated transcriptional regulator, MarR family [Leptospira fainei serovar Hurstbridge str. BUT 6]|uniref:EPS-associated transcriptional regulator, MarR family n=1 Tax=Leptospira fainei serovar Hurstbridge str. BUT 6 TaxID=1193011 RepID=S3W7P7_9LEPT|nr:MarR family EPS-associated transcriptional regulator [Leptospira fainei]EPG76112.1 EPS-associated transcriptional regulator, MarR family [Leptospira fainei serovar Hurstbridge str. BUT 6]
MTDELRHKILKLIEDRPDFNQRDLANALGISLGKTNYCLKALLEKGWIKAKNFKNSKNKLAYAYILTPAGLEEKIKLTLTYYSIKKREYEELREELEKLGIGEEGLTENDARISDGQ